MELWIIEDHDFYRQEIAEALERSERWDGPVREFNSAEAALEGLRHRTTQPDCVLLDIQLPGLSGLEILTELKTTLRQCPVILLTSSEDHAHVKQALRQGADGYLLKATSISRILDAIEDAAAGGLTLDAKLTRELIQEPAIAPALTEETPALSNREIEILTLAAEGKVKKEMAEAINVSFHTIDTYLRRSYKKLEVNSLHEAVAKAMRLGLL